MRERGARGATARSRSDGRDWALSPRPDGEGLESWRGGVGMAGRLLGTSALTSARCRVQGRGDRGTWVTRAAETPAEDAPASPQTEEEEPAETPMGEDAQDMGARCDLSVRLQGSLAEAGREREEF
ncbi:hypothetical protein PAL_GLEAN10002339 [Pteropus alecto]|uniref:Uncharacterized protein n=1 Tax=Pteropus alecto TaxID=9402 RepID=L5KCD4_PTEAL|nr:hypothetical protein PAL_GLEAN10002339 [Pteropus alecto]